MRRIERGPVEQTWRISSVVGVLGGGDDIVDPEGVLSRWVDQRFTDAMVKVRC